MHRAEPRRTRASISKMMCGRADMPGPSTNRFAGMSARRPKSEAGSRRILTGVPQRGVMAQTYEPQAEKRERKCLIHIPRFSL